MVHEETATTWVPARSRPILLESGGDPPRVPPLTLGEGVVVRGRIDAGDGGVPDGAWVILTGPGGLKRARVDPDGAYEIRGVAPRPGQGRP